MGVCGFVSEGGRERGDGKMIAVNKRMKRTTGVLKSREDAERCLGEYARLTIERDAIAAEMDERIRAIRAEYEGRLSDLTQDAEVEFDLLADWAARNPAEFGERKSLELTHGTIGFRTGTPKLKTLRGFTWDRVMERLVVAEMQRYLRQRTEPAKDLLIADRELLGDESLKAVGLQVVQDETFFLEAKREEVAAG